MKLPAQELKQKLDQGADKICYIDVRSPAEFRGGHLPGATCLPLDQLDTNINLIPRDKLVVLGCQAGMRSNQAFELLKKRGFTNIAQLEGGISAWAQAGLPVHSSSEKTPPIPIMRQVQITAGALVLLGLALGIFVAPAYFAVAAFIGAGQIFAGLSGWCGMAILLGKLPWNRS